MIFWSNTISFESGFPHQIKFTLFLRIQLKAYLYMRFHRENRERLELTLWTLCIISVLLLGCPVVESAPSCKARTAASAKPAPFFMCSLMIGVLIFKASFSLYGLGPAGISAPSMNTKSTVILPLTGFASYGRGCSVSTCVDAGPTANSSMPTKPKPRNLADSTPLAGRSYTSNKISADCGDNSLNKTKGKTINRAKEMKRWKLTIGNVHPNRAWHPV